MPFSVALIWVAQFKTIITQTLTEYKVECIVDYVNRETNHSKLFLHRGSDFGYEHSEQSIQINIKWMDLCQTYQVSPMQPNEEYKHM